MILHIVRSEVTWQDRKIKEKYINQHLLQNTYYLTEHCPQIIKTDVNLLTFMMGIIP